jgi:hypothetical protein
MTIDLVDDSVMTLCSVSGEPDVANGVDRLMIDHEALSRTMNCNVTLLVFE